MFDPRTAENRVKAITSKALALAKESEKEIAVVFDTERCTITFPETDNFKPTATDIILVLAYKEHIIIPKGEIMMTPGNFTQEKEVK